MLEFQRTTETAMRYLFNFSFQIEDEAGDPDDDIDQTVEMLFSVDAAALGISDTSASDPSYPSDHLEWMSDHAEVLEESFNAVHDFCGTDDDEVMIEGFCTYEIETLEQAADLMAKWRTLFVARTGREDAVGPIVSYLARNHQDLQTPTQIADFVHSFGTKPTSSPRI